ncbi:MAG: CotH kinase family protein [Kiritimatiellae bacterium]|nr:CotH kinase family protein [Kiritimatiellia bacterium]
MADNETCYVNSLGTYEDWVELHNTDQVQSADISGWYLGRKKKKIADNGWRIPDGTVIPPNGYLLIFCDKLNTVTNGELHADFKISKDGNDDYLWLIDAEENVVSEIDGKFPRQLEDVSYGLGASADTVVDTKSPMTYTVNGTAGTGTGGIGFTASSASAGFTCVHYQFNRTINSLSNVKTYMNRTYRWSANPVTNVYETLLFADAATDTGFSGHVPFPAYASVDQGADNFALDVTGAIYVPRAGMWTFCVGSDDGFELVISGNGVSFSTEVTGGHSFAPTFLACNFPEAGVYDVSLLFFEMTGAGVLEFSAAEGDQDTFSNTLFIPVGAANSPLKQTGALIESIDTDIGNAMKGKASMVRAVWPFTVDRPVIDSAQLTLSLRYADGFVAELNGTRVAFRNWDGNDLTATSVATAKRDNTAAMVPERFTLDASLVREGENELVIYGLNDAADDPDFLIAPELIFNNGGAKEFYFRSPTPGSANALQTYTAPTPPVLASEPRGYKTEAFDVTLTCPERPDAPIYYTLDGSIPSSENGMRYTGPIHIAATTVLRASVPDPESIFQNSTGYTWLFMADILNQTSSSPPAGWPASGAVNNHTMRYGLNTTVLNADRERFINGMTNAEHVATISMVTALDNLFNAQTGIYVNPGNDGVGWEREASIELIDPVHGAEQEFQINAGIRIRGAASRDKGNPKHSFRLLFRESWGPSKLAFRLFGEEGTDEYKKVDLRTEQNHSWHSTSENRNTFVRDVFSRDSQRDMGASLYDRSRYYHLFINGIYWGLYQTEERPEEHFAESYLGTDKQYWDVVKKDASRHLVCNNGSFEAYDELFNMVINQGFTGIYSNNYWKVQGLNPDGSVNPTFKPLLDIDNLIIYVMITHFTADPDAPISEWSNFSNNVIMLYDQTQANPGFKWIRHDSEHSMGAYSSSVSDSTYGYPANCFDWGTERDSSNFLKRENLNPLIIHDRLIRHELYKRRFSDAIRKHFYGDGALTIAQAKARVQARMNEIDDAIVGEAVRWGRGKTRNDWLTACSAVMTFIQGRHPVLLQQYKSKGWLSDLDPPTFSLTNETVVADGGSLVVTADRPFYYTTDGRDPKDLPEGVVYVGEETPSGTFTLALEADRWSYFDRGLDPSVTAGDWKTPAFDDSAWPQGNGIFGFAGSGGSLTVTTPTARYTTADPSVQVMTTYYRRKVTLGPGAGRCTTLTGKVYFDDGYIFYINGQEVARKFMDGKLGEYQESSSDTIRPENGQNAYQDFWAEIPEGLLHEGENTLAVEVHQCHGTSTDFLFDLQVDAVASAAIMATIPITQDTVIFARSFENGEWSSLASVTLYTVPEYEHFRVTEMMYAAPDSTGNYIEMMNVGEKPIRLVGVNFTAGIVLQFGNVVIQPGERMVLVKDVEAFRAAYAFPESLQIIPFDSGNTAKKGETIAYADPSGNEILSYTYTRDWYPQTVETGRALVVVDPSLANGEAGWSDGTNWIASRVIGGTPGKDEPLVIAFQAISLNGNKVILKIPKVKENYSVWVSDDIALPDHWKICPKLNSTVVKTGDFITVDSSRPLFPYRDSKKLFFRVVSEE